MKYQKRFILEKLKSLDKLKQSNFKKWDKWYADKIRNDDIL